MKTAEAMTALGHDVTVFALKGDGVDPYAFYGVERTFPITFPPLSTTKGWPWRSVLDPSVPPRLRVALSTAYTRVLAGQLKRAGPFDLVYGRGVLAGEESDSTLVFDVHRIPLTRIARGTMRSVLARDRVKVLFTCDYIRTMGLQHFAGLDGARTAVAYLGADPAHLHGEQLTPDGWPGRPGHLQAGYVGALFTGKGVPLVVDVARRTPDVDFHIVGASKDELTAQTESIPNLHAHGFVPHARVPAYIDSFDVALLPIQPAPATNRVPITFPMKLFEYMARGKLILASDVPVIREVFTDEICVLLPHDDPDAWSRALRASASESDRRTASGERARRVFESTYTWRHRAERLLQLVD
jgi:glycosyltransferase involved in cell wall biosynthesis